MDSAIDHGSWMCSQNVLGELRDEVYGVISHFLAPFPENPIMTPTKHLLSQEVRLKIPSLGLCLKLSDTIKPFVEKQLFTYL
jgi:hypothetical protein